MPETVKGGGGGAEKEGVAGPDKEAVVGMDDLYSALESTVKLPKRSPDGALFLAVDHCFPIKGQVCMSVYIASSIGPDS